jgi:hypothetical protein
MNSPHNLARGNFSAQPKDTRAALREMNAALLPSWTSTGDNHVVVGGKCVHCKETSSGVLRITH